MDGVLFSASFPCGDGLIVVDPGHGYLQIRADYDSSVD